METLRLVIVTALCAGGAAAALAADPYPNKPIVLTVAYAPGGGSDNTAPAIAEAAPPLLSQPTVANNNPDASGSIGWTMSRMPGPTATRWSDECPLLEVRRGMHEVRDVQNIADILVDPEAGWVQAQSGNLAKPAKTRANGSQPHSSNGSKTANRAVNTLRNTAFRKLIRQRLPARVFPAPNG